MPNIDDHEITETGHKALHINLDATKYGTFAEIGAGQEVGRWFFRVGGAAGTVAWMLSPLGWRVTVRFDQAGCADASADCNIKLPAQAGQLSFRLPPPAAEMLSMGMGFKLNRLAGAGGTRPLLPALPAL